MKVLGFDLPAFEHAVLNAARLTAQLQAPGVRAGSPARHLMLTASKLNRFRMTIVMDIDTEPMSQPIAQLRDHMQQYQGDEGTDAVLRDLGLILAYLPDEPGDTAGYLLALVAHFK